MNALHRMEHNPLMITANYGMIALNTLIAAITAHDINVIAAGLGILVTLMGNAYKVVEGYYKIKDIMRKRKNTAGKNNTSSTK